MERTRIERKQDSVFNHTMKWCVALTLAIVLGSPLLAASPATAQELGEDSQASLKEYWQTKYRGLLQERARLESNIAISRNNYARAQRRNYPRGNARQRFLIEAEEAEVDLVKIKVEIEEMFVEARNADVVPGWLYDVEEEAIAIPQPAAAEPQDVEDREGRNPLYLGDDSDS